MADLTTLFRGEPWVGPSTMLNLENQGYRASNRFVNPSITGLDSFKNLTKDDLARLSGQYWTDNPRYAGTYAGSTGKIKSMNIPSSDLDKFSRFEKKVTRLPSGKYVHAGNPAGAYLVPKSTLTKYNPKLNIGRTIQNLAKDFDYPFKHGLQWTTTRNPITKLMDEGRILKAGWDLYEDATLGERLSGVGKHISKSGLAFLRNNALKGLGVLGSLPAQAGLMTLSPTHLGMDDIPDWHKTTPTAPPGIKNPGGGDGGYRASRPASERRHTGHGRSGMGRDPRDRMAMGGLIDLYRYGGFI